MPAEDVNIIAKKVNGAYTVTLPEHVSVVSVVDGTYTTDGKYTTGTTITFKADFLYKMANVSAGNSTLIGDDGLYTVTVADQDIVITADVNTLWEGDVSTYDFLIKTTTDLDNLAKMVNSGVDCKGWSFRVTNNITYQSNGSDNNYTAIGDSRTGTGRPPKPFSGTFDGGGYTISGIRINKPNESFHGIFGFIGKDAVVMNIKLADANITGQGAAGGIVGSNDGKIANCTVASDVIINVQKNTEDHGGIAGSNKGIIYGCTSSVTIMTYGGLKYGTIVGYNDGTLQNNFYSNCTVSGVQDAKNVGCDGRDITTNNGAVHLDILPDLIIDGDSESPVAITASQTGANVLYLRNITAGIPTTIMLPFNFDASAFDGGTFYTFTGINTETWEATMTSGNELSTLSANTPYIYTAEKDMTSVTFSNVSIEKTEAGAVTKGDWTFKGTYERMEWNTGSEITTTNVYGFAAQFGTNRDDKTYTAGEFVRARYNVSIKPTRAYLEYTVEDNTLSKSALVLPDRISVVFIDKETASVIDDPAANAPNTGDTDITTPVSEITPTIGNVNVWSYDHTIYIAAAPGTDYRIIDASGRTLRAAATLTDRDEIRLGNHSGIAIVIINNKTYKVTY